MTLDTKKFVLVQMMWIGISLAVSIALSLLLPFPVSLLAIIAILILISYVIRRRQMQGMEFSRGKRFGILGTSTSNRASYYCINCGTKHNKAACPFCGSKLKKASFGS
jgi:uncharacterized paraquat-inducible protein A